MRENAVKFRRRSGGIREYSGKRAGALLRPGLLAGLPIAKKALSCRDLRTPGAWPADAI